MRCVFTTSIYSSLLICTPLSDPSRLLLAATESSCHKWIEDENALPALLSVADRRLLATDEDGELLIEKEVLDDMYKQIVDFFPPSCMNADLKYIRQALTTEKSRVRRLQERESGGGAVAATSTSIPKASTPS